MKAFDPKEYKRDILVVSMRRPDFLLFVFPTGARIDDKSGLLEGKFSDGRKLAKFRSIEELNEKRKDLQQVIRNWLETIER